MKPHDDWAFPLQRLYDPENLGMTLRDYFAGQALAASHDRWCINQQSLEDIGKWCYMTADAMLKARET